MQNFRNRPPACNTFKKVCNSIFYFFQPKEKCRPVDESSEVANAEDEPATEKRALKRAARAGANTPSKLTHTEKDDKKGRLFFNFIIVQKLFFFNSEYII